MQQSYLLLLMLFLLIASCTKEKKVSLPPVLSSEQKKLDDLEIVVASKPMLENDKSNVRLTGQVAYLNRANLTFQTDGIINKIIAKPGMSFKRGQVLAELDTRDLEFKLKTSKYQVDLTKNKMNVAKRDFDVEQKLRADNVNSPMQLENSKLLYDNAVLDFNIAEVNWKIAQKKLTEAKLKAPYDCVIVKQIKYVSESAGGNSDKNGVFEINEVGDPELHLNAPESLLKSVAIGSSISVFFPALNVELPAKIIRFVPIISASNRQFLIVAKLNAPDTRVVPGYFIEGMFKI